MKTYPTVEDYLEVLSGARDIVTGKTNPSYFFGFDPIISLARYDVSVLTSMNEATTNGKALTEKQGELLCKVLLKYRRQLGNKSIDVTPIEKPAWRVPLRKMDYTQSLSLQDDKLILKFPYNVKQIETLRNFKSTSQGSFVFSPEQKQWVIALTEFNLNWVHAFAKINNFEIDPEVERLNNLVLEMELTPYAIELDYNESGLTIANCPTSLRDYIENNLGGFGLENTLRLVDYSSVLGYTINADFASALAKEYGSRFMLIATNREVKINPEAKTVDDDFASVIEYAQLVERFPVVIYEPDISGRLLNKLKELVDETEIEEVKNGKIDEQKPTTKFIYTIRPLTNVDKIAMLISTGGIIVGSSRSAMIQNAERLVYVSSDVYAGTVKTSKKIVKL